MVQASGTLTAGKLRIRNRALFDESLSSWRDGEVVITVEHKHATRSPDQNRYYWGVVVSLLSNETGFTPDEMHDVLKAKFLPKKLAVTDNNGEIHGEYVIGGSTSKLNKIEFGDYMEAIRRWAAEDLSIVIPDPVRG